MNSTDLIIDGQFGSSGKGTFGAYLARRHLPDTIAFAPSPNAGHTLIHDGETRVHKMLPCGYIAASVRQIILGPGSMIDCDQLDRELDMLPDRVSVAIHQNAAVVRPRHRTAEADGWTAPGSTRSGAGAALRDKLTRNRQDAVIGFCQHPVLDRVELVDTSQMQELYRQCGLLQVESCQGYGLSIQHGTYPYTTSRDVTTASILSDCGVPHTNLVRVYGIFRTYPIRVANRQDEWSGPCYPDSVETSFEDIGQVTELTTVTKLPRRIFTWSALQAREACSQNGIGTAFLNFCNYPRSFDDLLDIWKSLNLYTNVRWVGFGPNLGDIYGIGAPELCTDRLHDLWKHHRAAAINRGLG